MSDGCTSYQVVYSGLTPGSYVAKITPRDSSGASSVNGPVESSFVMGTDDLIHEAVVPMSAWVADYTGTFRFRILWNGVDCADATPPVTSERLTLSKDGKPFTNVTRHRHRARWRTAWRVHPGQRGRRGLRAVRGRRAVRVRNIHIVGRDSNDETVFEEEFETFVGVGALNDDLVFDVDAIPTDAPDGGPDAGATDAGVPDA